MFFVILGWASFALFLSSQVYIAMSNNYNRNIFFALNLAGCIAIVLSSYNIESWVTVIYNSIWAIISITAFMDEKKKIPCPISIKTFNTLIVIAVSTALLTLSLNQILAINIFGYSSISFIIIAYILYTKKEITETQYLIYFVIATPLNIPLLFHDNNIPAITTHSMYIILSLAGLIKHYYYQDRKKAIQ